MDIEAAGRRSQRFLGHPGLQLLGLLSGGRGLCSMPKAKQTKESAMQTRQAEYFGAYRTIKMTRDAKGVLVVEFHSNGGPCTFSAQHHTEVVDAFHRIAQDRANKIVILTGADGDF